MSVAAVLRPRATVVGPTINLGHDLGLQVVAEGVEDEATLQDRNR
jgi:EAL domain-containing protein (putative c-di-GMP-specific phosphodiesterase class I)